MSSVGSLLVSRGAELVYSRSPVYPKEHSQLHNTMSIFQIVLFLVFIGVLLPFAYVSTVVTTLAEVEDSNSNSYIRLEDHGSNPSYNDDEDLKPSDSKHITAGFRSTIRYLGARGGIWACFRGFRMFLAISGAETALSLLFTFIPGVSMKPAFQQPFWQLTIWQIPSSLLTATCRMAWVHQVIADKSPRSRYWRMIGYQHWPKIAPAAALQSISRCAAFAFFAAALKFGQDFALTIARIRENATYEPTLVFLAIFITASIIFVLIPLPAEVIFSRVAASMLPAEDDPIVPFDRTFGGRVKPESLGGNGRVGISDALKTFGGSAWNRYVKLNLKVHGIILASSAAGAFLLLSSSVIGIDSF